MTLLAIYQIEAMGQILVLTPNSTTSVWVFNALGYLHAESGKSPYFVVIFTAKSSGVLCSRLKLFAGLEKGKLRKLIKQ
jgi:hypothetical protein